MTKRAYTLLQTILAVSASLFVVLGLISLLRSLLHTASDRWVTDGEIHYAVSPSLSEGLRAARFHLAFNRLRREADTVAVFGGVIYRAFPVGDWYVDTDRALKMDFDKERLSQLLRTEEDSLWFQRLAYLGGSDFLLMPDLLLLEQDKESLANERDYTLLLVSGRNLSGVVQVRGRIVEMSSVTWQMWQCRMWDLGREAHWEYRCAWQLDEQIAIPSPSIPFAGVEEGRWPGARQYRVQTGTAEGGELVFSEVVFPDPLLTWAAGSEQAGSYPIPRYFYLFFVQ